MPFKTVAEALKHFGVDRCQYCGVPCTGLFCFDCEVEFDIEVLDMPEEDGSNSPKVIAPANTPRSSSIRAKHRKISDDTMQEKRKAFENRMAEKFGGKKAHTVENRADWVEDEADEE